MHAAVQVMNLEELDHARSIGLVRPIWDGQALGC